MAESQLQVSRIEQVISSDLPAVTSPVVAIILIKPAREGLFTRSDQIVDA